MGKLKSLLGSTFAAMYFIFLMSIVLLLLIFMPLGFLTEVDSMRSSGFATPNSAASFIGVSGLIIGLSLLIPPLRKMYGALPWLYSFTKIFFVNLIILNVALTILNIGYQINNSARHTMFFILMILQLVICRIAMCIYFRLKPVKHIEVR
jgi:hypothetical protein